MGIGYDPPWYPTLRPFRQPTPLDWPSVFARIGTELRRLAGKAAALTAPRPPSPALVATRGQKPSFSRTMSSSETFMA